MNPIDKVPHLEIALTRRQTIAGAAVAIAGLAFGSTESLAAPDEGITHTSEAIHQEPVFTASPKLIYEALMDPAQFQKIESLSGAMKGLDLTGKPVQINQVTTATPSPAH